MPEKAQDLLIIGAGIMGLSTAYHASHFTKDITILDKSTIGNQQAASFSLTRSVRNDYLDPFYARLAYEARQLWLELQARTEETFLIDCGCLNLAHTSVTPQLAETYAVRSYQTLEELHLRAEGFVGEDLKQRFPQFSVDEAYLDVEAGCIYVPIVTQKLQTTLQERGVNIVENVAITRIEQRDDLLLVQTNLGDYKTHKLVIVGGLGTNDVLATLDGCSQRFALQPDRPSQCKYFVPPAEKRAQFTSDQLPVFAYLDVGIYGHPILEGRTPGVKIGFYHPPDVQTDNSRIHDVHSFVAECMPSLQDAEAFDVRDVDQCYYDLVSDDNFILGQLPDFENVYVGVGWRGTGYKYAPWIGKTLMQLTLQGGTVYDIARFSPARFVSGKK